MPPRVECAVRHSPPSIRAVFVVMRPELQWGARILSHEVEYFPGRFDLLLGSVAERIGLPSAVHAGEALGGTSARRAGLRATPGSVVWVSKIRFDDGNGIARIICASVAWERYSTVAVGAWVGRSGAAVPHALPIHAMANGQHRCLIKSSSDAKRNGRAPLRRNRWAMNQRCPTTPSSRRRPRCRA